MFTRIFCPYTPNIVIFSAAYKDCLLQFKEIRSSCDVDSLESASRIENEETTQMSCWFYTSVPLSEYEKTKQTKKPHLFKIRI